MQCKILLEVEPIEGLQRSGSDLIPFDLWLNKPTTPTRVQCSQLIALWVSYQAQPAVTGHFLGARRFFGADLDVFQGTEAQWQGLLVADPK